jgi:hypothetical protein
MRTRSHLLCFVTALCVPAVTAPVVNDLVPSPRLTVPGEVVFEGAPPDIPVEAKFSLTLSPMTRAPFGAGEYKAMSARADIPGTFAFEGLFLDEYSLQIPRLPGILYIRDITCGGHSIFL